MILLFGGVVLIHDYATLNDVLIPSSSSLYRSFQLYGMIKVSKRLEYGEKYGKPARETDSERRGTG